QNDGPEGQPFPDMRVDHRAAREGCIVKPRRTVGLQQAPDHLVEQTPLAVQHPMDRDIAGDGRDRPGRMNTSSEILVHHPLRMKNPDSSSARNSFKLTATAR